MSYQACAKFDYASSCNGHLTFHVGDILDVYDDMGGEDWVAATLDGRNGLVPRSYVTSVSSSGEMYRASHAFELTGERQCSLEVGEHVTLLSDGLGEWAAVLKADGTQGLVPVSYIEEVHVDNRVLSVKERQQALSKSLPTSMGGQVHHTVADDTVKKPLEHATLKRPAPPGRKRPSRGKKRWALVAASVDSKQPAHNTTMKEVAIRAQLHKDAVLLHPERVAGGPRVNEPRTLQGSDITQSNVTEQSTQQQGTQQDSVQGTTVSPGKKQSSSTEQRKQQHISVQQGNNRSRSTQPGKQEKNTTPQHKQQQGTKQQGPTQQGKEGITQQGKQQRTTLQGKQQNTTSQGKQQGTTQQGKQQSTKQQQNTEQQQITNQQSTKQQSSTQLGRQHKGIGQKQQYTTQQDKQQGTTQQDQQQDTTLHGKQQETTQQDQQQDTTQQGGSSTDPSGEISGAREIAGEVLSSPSPPPKPARKKVRGSSVGKSTTKPLPATPDHGNSSRHTPSSSAQPLVQQSLDGGVVQSLRAESDGAQAFSQRESLHNATLSSYSCSLEGTRSGSAEVRGRRLVSSVSRKGHRVGASGRHRKTVRRYRVYGTDSPERSTTTSGGANGCDDRDSQQTKWNERENGPAIRRENRCERTQESRRDSRSDHGGGPNRASEYNARADNRASECGTRSGSAEVRGRHLVSSVSRKDHRVGASGRHRKAVRRYRVYGTNSETLHRNYAGNANQVA